MSLLTICQDAAVELQIDRPDAVAGQIGIDQRRLFRYANRVGIKLMRGYHWQILRREHTFTALAGSEQTGILPSDFDRLVPEAFFDRTNRHLVTGPISAVQWQGLKANGYVAPERKFTLRNDIVYAIPDFDGGESLAFEYITDEWCQSSGGTGQTKFAADTDVARIDEELITLSVVYLYNWSQGLPFEGNMAAANECLNDLVRNDEPSAGVLSVADIFGDSSSRHFTGEPAVSGAGTVI